MPIEYIWSPPDLFLEYRDVKVYHAYDEDNELTFHYTWDPEFDDIEGPSDDAIFDVRELAFLKNLRVLWRRRMERKGT